MYEYFVWMYACVLSTFTASFHKYTYMFALAQLCLHAHTNTSKYIHHTHMHVCTHACTQVHTHIPQANLLISYLPNLSTKSPTRREPRKPPKGYMDTVTDHSSVRVKESRDSPVLSL